MALEVITTEKWQIDKEAESALAVELEIKDLRVFLLANPSSTIMEL